MAVTLCSYTFSDPFGWHIDTKRRSSQPGSRINPHILLPLRTQGWLAFEILRPACSNHRLIINLDKSPSLGYLAITRGPSVRRKGGVLVATGFADLESLPREQLLAIAHEYMLSGMLGSPGGSATVAGAGISPEAGTAITIEEWMGSSPVYTGRMRRLMGIEGHDVPAIMKALQLDMGFVHGFMNVAYSVDPTNSNYGEFWLLHCGALLMVEPAGEAAVFHMCHTIEDPTFDATALATNPRARIRPIHRPPRIPADKHPHCHWTIEISDAHEPVGPIALAEYVGALPLAEVPNAITGADMAGHFADYSGPFRAEFRLNQLSDGALAAVTREFQMQLHLKAAAHEASLARHVDPNLGRAAMDEGWLTPAWIVGERVARVLGLGTGLEAVAALLAFTPVLPPGFDRRADVEGNHLTVIFTPVVDGLLDPEHPGLVGALVRGATGGIEGTLGALGHRPIGLSIDLDGSSVRAEMDLEQAAADSAPMSVSLSRLGPMANWSFNLTPA